MVDLVVEEEEETAAGWRSPGMMETGPNRCRVTNALNSESVLLVGMMEMYSRQGKLDKSALQCDQGNF